MFSSLFDVLGFIAPLIMKAKLLLQELCPENRGWDSAINEQERVQWFRWQFHTFESNRLTMIRSVLSPTDWFDNPADDASKGLRLEEIVCCARFSREFQTLY